MIDKVEARISQQERLRHLPNLLYSALRRGEKIPGFAPTRYYAHVGSLKDHMGLDAILHLGNRFNDGNHKLEILEAGKKSYREIMEITGQVVNSDPGEVEIMRIDLAADIPGYPVKYFRRHTRAQWKQWSCEHGRFVLEYSAMGKRNVQTLYFGKRPNTIRFYDKVADWRDKYRRKYRTVLHQLRRNENPLPEFDGVNFEPKEFPTFEQEYGVADDAVLTRCERVLAAGRVDDACSHLGNLPVTLPEFNPFTRLKFVKDDLPDYDSLTADDLLKVLGLQKLVEDLGKQEAYRVLNSERNASRIFAKYEKYLPTDGDEPDAFITEQQLFETYRESVTKQLAS